MSFKAKDLQFERQEPAFLKRLKAGIADATDDPDRQVNPLKFPKKPKRLENDDDDAPTYVVEDSNETLSKEEYEELLKKSKDEDENGSRLAKQSNPDDKATSQDSSRPKQLSIQVGAISKKRKAIKVVGDDEAEEAESPSKAASAKKPILTKSKKKAKVKLSFNDEEEG